MDGLEWKTLLELMIWGYHYFWKHPGASTHNSLSETTSTARLLVLQRNFPKLLLFHRPCNAAKETKKKTTRDKLESIFSSPWSPYNPLVRHHFLGGLGGIILKLTWWSPFRSAKKLFFTFEAALAKKKMRIYLHAAVPIFDSCLEHLSSVRVCASFFCVCFIHVFTLPTTPRDALGIGL